MNIAKMFKQFIYKLTGKMPRGNTIAEVIKNGSNEVCNINNLNSAVNEAVKYEAADKKSFVLNSSTAESTKKFRITVVDAGTISATEITE